MTANQQMKNMLDQLMGTNRDGENKSAVKFSSTKVCRSFLLNCCPHDILSATRMDLGKCSRIHDVALRADYAQASKEKDYFFDIDATEHLERFIADCDKTTEEAKVRLLETQEELSAEVTQKMSHINALSDKIGQKLAKAEEKGEAGLVEESMKLMEEVELIRKEKLTAEQQYRNSMPSSNFQQQKLRVCEVCSAYLGIYDNDHRLADHFGGKLHLGFIEIREKLAKLQANVEQRRIERRNAYNRERQRASRSRSRDRSHGEGVDEDGERGDDRRARVRHRHADSGGDRSVSEGGSDCDLPSYLQNERALTRSLPVGMAKRSRGGFYRRPIDRMYALTKREVQARGAGAGEVCAEPTASRAARELPTGSARGLTRSTVGGRCGGIASRGRGIVGDVLIPMMPPVGEPMAPLPPLPTGLIPNPEAARLLTSSKRRRRRQQLRSRSSSYSSRSRSSSRSYNRRRSRRRHSYSRADTRRSRYSSRSRSHSSRSSSRYSCSGRSCDEHNRSASRSPESRASSDEDQHRRQRRRASTHSSRSGSQSSSSESGLDRRIRRIRERDGMDSEFQQRINAISTVETPSSHPQCNHQSQSSKWRTVADLGEETVDSCYLDVASIPVPGAKTVFKLSAKSNLHVSNLHASEEGGNPTRRLLKSSETANTASVAESDQPASADNVADCSKLHENGPSSVQPANGSHGEATRQHAVLGGEECVDSSVCQSTGHEPRDPVDAGPRSRSVSVESTAYRSSSVSAQSDIDTYNAVSKFGDQLTGRDIKECRVVLEPIPTELLQKFIVNSVDKSAVSLGTHRQESCTANSKSELADQRSSPAVSISSSTRVADVVSEQLSPTTEPGSLIEKFSNTAQLVSLSSIKSERASSKVESVKQYWKLGSKSVTELHSKRYNEKHNKADCGSTGDNFSSTQPMREEAARSSDTNGSTQRQSGVRRLSCPDDLEVERLPCATIGITTDGMCDDKTPVSMRVSPGLGGSEDNSGWRDLSSDGAGRVAPTKNPVTDRCRQVSARNTANSDSLRVCAANRPRDPNSDEEELDYEYEYADHDEVSTVSRIESTKSHESTPKNVKQAVVNDRHATKHRPDHCKRGVTRVKSKRSDSFESYGAATNGAGGTKLKGSGEHMGSRRSSTKEEASPAYSSNSRDDRAAHRFKSVKTERGLYAALESNPSRSRRSEVTEEVWKSSTRTGNTCRSPTEVTQYGNLLKEEHCHSIKSDENEVLCDIPSRTGLENSKGTNQNSAEVCSPPRKIAFLNEQSNQSSSKGDEALPVPGSRQALRRLRESRSVLLSEISEVQNQIDSVCSLGQRRAPAGKNEPKTRQSKRHSDSDSHCRRRRRSSGKHERRSRKHRRHRERRRRSLGSPGRRECPVDRYTPDGVKERPQLTDWFDVDSGAKQTAKSSIAIRAPLELAESNVKVKNRQGGSVEKSGETPAKIGVGASSDGRLSKSASKHIPSRASKSVSKLSKQIDRSEKITDQKEVVNNSSSELSGQKPEENFAQLISAVFCSNDLSDSVKYQIVSRLSNTMAVSADSTGRRSPHGGGHQNNSARNDHLASIVQLNKQLISMLMGGVMSKVSPNPAPADVVGAECSSDPPPTDAESIRESLCSDLPSGSSRSESPTYSSRPLGPKAPDASKIPRVLQSPTRPISRYDGNKTSKTQPATVPGTKHPRRVLEQVVGGCSEVSNYRSRAGGEHRRGDNLHRRKRPRRSRSHDRHVESGPGGKRSRRRSNSSCPHSVSPPVATHAAISPRGDRPCGSRDRYSSSSSERCARLRETQRSRFRGRSSSSRSRSRGGSSASSSRRGSGSGSEKGRRDRDRRSVSSERVRRDRDKHSASSERGRRDRDRRSASSGRPVAATRHRGASRTAGFANRGRSSRGSIHSAVQSADRPDRQWRPQVASTKHALWTPRNPLDRCNADATRAHANASHATQLQSPSIPTHHQSRQQQQCKMQ